MPFFIFDVFLDTYKLVPQELGMLVVFLIIFSAESVDHWGFVSESLRELDVEEFSSVVSR